MLFHITARHTPENCQVAHGSGPSIPSYPARYKEAGVEPIAGGSCPPAHASFLLVETDDMSRLTELLRPALGHWQVEINNVPSTEVLP